MSKRKSAEGNTTGHAAQIAQLVARIDRLVRLIDAQSAMIDGSRERIIILEERCKELNTGLFTLTARIASAKQTNEMDLTAEKDA
jgi:hypothetical protein